MIETWFNQDTQQAVKVRYIDGNVFSMDNNGNKIGVNMFENGSPFDISGTISANVIRADGATVSVTGSCSNNQAWVVLPQAAYAVPGVISIILKLTESGNVTTLCAAVANVYQSSTDTVVDPGTIIPSIEDLLEAIQAAVATIPPEASALWASIAPAYSTTSTYAIGQYCTNDGGLYKCVYDITSGETWNPAHWVAVDIGREMYEDDVIREDITGVPVLGNFQKGKAYRTGDGDTIDISNPRTNSGMWALYSPCVEGDIFTLDIYNVATVNYRPWCFIDSSGNQILRAPDNHGFYTNEVITAPANSAYVVFNMQVPSNNGTNRGRHVYKGKLLSSVNTDIDNIKAALGTKETIVSGVPDYGYYWNSETSTAVKTEIATFNAYPAITVAKGEDYHVHIFQADSTKQWPVLLVDDDYTIIEHYGARSQTYGDLYFTIPNGVTKLLMTTRRAYPAYAYKRTIKPVDDSTYDGTFSYAGKNIAIIGDSISTNGDYSESNPLGNVPEIVVQNEDIGVQLSAYVTYYDVGTTVGGHTITESEVGSELTFTPVEGDVGKMVGKPKNNNAASVVTWWEVAQSIFGFNAIPVCWSGSSITDHEENNQEDGHYIYKCAHAFHPSQIRKCGIRTPGTMTRTAPDMVIIYRGTNDFSHSPYTRLSDYLDVYPVTLPDNDTFDDGGTTRYCYLKGLALTVKKIREAYPDAQIVVCTFNYFRRISSDEYPTRNGINTIYQYDDAIRRFADYFGCNVIEFDKDGLNYANAAEEYYQEGTSSTAKWTHPTTKGHKVMGNRALLDMRKVNDMT